jgi:superfamily II DNA helicase RecQ
MLSDSKLKLDQYGKVGTYTGETPSRTRGKLRDHFVSNKVSGIVGTSAFGMGIDKPDLQCITYIGRPYSVKDLYQAFGRVARNSNWMELLKEKESAVMQSVFSQNFRELALSGLNLGPKRCLKGCGICYQIRFDCLTG